LNGHRLVPVVRELLGGLERLQPVVALFDDRDGLVDEFGELVDRARRAEVVQLAFELRANRIGLLAKLRRGQAVAAASSSTPAAGRQREAGDCEENR
jgi:hypothetical protein